MTYGPDSGAAGHTGSLTLAGTTSGSTALTAGALGYLGIGTTTPDMTVGIGGSLEVNSGATPTGATTNSINATAASMTVTGGTGLSATGQFVFFPGNGGGTQEVAYGTFSGSTFTFSAPPIGACASATAGRGCYGTTAQSHGNGNNFYAVNTVLGTGIANLPQLLFTIGGPQFINPSLSAMANAGFTTSSLFIGTQVSITNGNGLVFGQPNGPVGGLAGVNTSGIELFAQNNNGNNATLITNSITPSRPIATQSITGTSLTAITTAVTPAYPANASAASASVHGMLRSDCTIMYQQTVGVATVQFGVKLSAAPTALYVAEQDIIGTGLVPNTAPVTKITTTTTTATSTAFAPTSSATTYFSELTLIMNPGTTNSPSIQLYGLTSNASDPLVIQDGTGCTSWH